ncbi:MAG: hypothetical protein ABEH77_00270 [Halobacteriaceae archaeon]
MLGTVAIAGTIRVVEECDCGAWRRRRLESCDEVREDDHCCALQ